MNLPLARFSKSVFFGLLLVASTTFAQQKGMKAYITLFPAGDFVATTSDLTGSAQMVSANEVKAQNITINLNSLKTGLELRDDHAKNKYLEVQKYPEAVLVSATGKDGKGSGILRLHGKEAKVDGTYVLTAGNKFLTAEFKSKLSLFGINEINYKGVGVDDEFKVEVTVPVVADTAVAAPAAAPAKKKGK